MFSLGENMRIFSVKLVKCTQHCTQLDNLRSVFFLFSLFISLLHFFFSSSRSVILRRKRSETDDSLVSEGLREAISSYIQMTDGSDFSWDTWGTDGVSAGTETDTARPRPICCLGPATVNEVTSSPQPNLGDDWQPLRTREHRHYILRGVCIFWMSAKNVFFIRNVLWCCLGFFFFCTKVQLGVELHWGFCSVFC